MATCPGCRADIPNKNINVQEGVALCAVCERVMRLAEVAQTTEDIESESAASEPPPSGCKIKQTMSGERIICSMRSMGAAAFLVVFTTFWNSIVSIFVFDTVVKTYRMFTPVSPDPASGSSGQASGTMGGFGLVGTWLFLIPFVLVGIGTFGLACLLLFGTIEVQLEAGSARVRTGAGPLRRTRVFDPNEVIAVRIHVAGTTKNGEPQYEVLLENTTGTIEFGQTLPERRRIWLAGVLRERLCDKRAT